MSFLVVALLSVLWLAFFLPSLLQARRISSPYASATTFQDSLRRLGEVPYPRPPGNAHPAAPASRAAAVAARRRDTLSVLAAATIAGVMIAVGFGGWARWAVLPPALALIGYVVLLRREVVRRCAQRAQAHVDDHAPVPMPAVADVASSAAQSAPLLDDEIVPSVARRSALPPAERMAG
jgi:hypothetical protein